MKNLTKADRVMFGILITLIVIMSIIFTYSAATGDYSIQLGSVASAPRG